MRSHIGCVICLAGVLGACPVLAAPFSGTPDGSGSAPTTPAPTAPAPAVPQRNANVYDGSKHEPAAGPTTQREEAAGVAGSAATQRRENDTVEQLDRQVEQN